MLKAFILLVLSIPILADVLAIPNGYFSSLNEAISTGKKDGRIIMLVMTSEACPWCKKLVENVLVDHHVSERIEKEFIPVLLDKNKDTYPDTFQSRFTPTIYFINPDNEEEVWSNIGYIDSEGILKVFDDAHEQNDVQ